MSVPLWVVRASRATRSSVFQAGEDQDRDQGVRAAVVVEDLAGLGVRDDLHDVASSQKA